jgi:threonine/homoserine/homoserine lactone efflux protein
MPFINQSKAAARRTPNSAFGPQVLFWLAVFATFVLMAGVVASVPAALVAPVAATLVFTIAATAGLVGWLREGGISPERVTYWDVAGALTLIGIGVAALVDPEQLARVFEAPPREK